ENVVESKPANRSHPQSVVAFTLRPSAADRAHHLAQQGEPGRAEGPCRVGKGEAGHRSDLSTEPSAGGHSLRRKGARASQGRHHSLKESLSIVGVILTLGDERTLHARNPLTSCGRSVRRLSAAPNSPLTEANRTRGATVPRMRWPSSVEM